LGNKDFSGDRRIRVATNFLSPGYFATLGIPLVAGRDFDDRDDVTSPKVVIISERLAAKFDGPAVGQSLDSSSGVAEVIGVAKDNRYATVKDAPRDVLYMPMFQHPGSLGYGPTFVVRHQIESTPALHAIRAVVTAVDPALPLFKLNTLEGYTRESLSQERLMAAASSYVGMFALLLASIGLYGLISYTVTERRPEIGLRMALGSSPRGIQAMVVRHAASMVLAGIVVGLLSAWWLVRFARGHIIDLQPLDPLSFALATTALLLVAAGAAWLPARRASRIDPITALRHE
jgi:ABC-type antimicrobial peptide transport system permease subunit